MKVGIPIILTLCAWAASARAETGAVLVADERAPAVIDVLKAYDSFGVGKLAATKDGFEVGALRVTMKLVAGVDARADAAAEASLMGFLQEWKPAPHKARVEVTATVTRADAGAFLRVMAAVAMAAHADAVYLPSYAVTQPAASFVEAVRKDPPLVVGWIGIERRMEGKRAAFASHGMALVGLPELTLTVPLERSADALTIFLEKLEQAQARPPDAKPLPSPWKIDLD